MTRTSLYSETEIERIMSQVDGVLGAAGHELTDPVARDIIRRNLRGELSDAETTVLLTQRSEELDAVDASNASRMGMTMFAPHPPPRPTHRRMAAPQPARSCPPNMGDTVS